MRALIALMVVLVAVLAGIVYLAGNPLQLLGGTRTADDALREAPAPEAPVVAATGTVTDATPDTATARREPPADASQPGQVEREARTFVRTLTEPAPEPVAVEEADHFVRPDQMIDLLPEDAIEETTLEALQADPTLDPDTPITVVRTVEQIEATTPERVIAESGGDLDAPIRVLGEDNEVEQSTVGEVLERHRRQPERPIMVVREVDHFEVTTVAELAREERERRQAALARAGAPAGDDAATAGSGAAPATVRVMPGAGEALAPSAASGPAAAAARSAQPPPAPTRLRIIRQPYTAAAATVQEILESRNLSVEEGSIFYVRTVRQGDLQGIWGIVHDGIIQNFARGVAIRRGEAVNTYRVDIPREADELRDDRSSSFLGRLIFDKTAESYVYNYRLNRMGQNPDRIFPGQELVIIEFRTEELVSIYRHFVGGAASETS